MMNPYGMGWHLDRALFDEIFRQCVCTVARGSISLVKGSFVGIDRVDGGSSWLVSVNEGGRSDSSVYRSKWVVDASGRKATVARKVNTFKLKPAFIAPSHTALARLQDSQRRLPVSVLCRLRWPFNCRRHRQPHSNRGLRIRMVVQLSTPRQPPCRRIPHGRLRPDVS